MLLWPIANNKNSTIRDFQLQLHKMWVHQWPQCTEDGFYFYIEPQKGTVLCEYHDILKIYTIFSYVYCMGAVHTHKYMCMPMNACTWGSQRGVVACGAAVIDICELCYNIKNSIVLAYKTDQSHRIENPHRSPHSYKSSDFLTEANDTHWRK